MKPRGTPDEGVRFVERRAPRRVLVSMAWYRTLPTTEGGETHEGVAAAIDLSKGGIGIFTARPLPTGVLVFVEVAFQVPASEPAGSHVSIVGRTMHCSLMKDGTFRVGIQMEVVPPNDRAVLARLLAP